LGFLGRSHFAAKTPVYGYWITLDFLGFSRPNRDLSMGYGHKMSKVFLIGFSMASAAKALGSACGSAEWSMR
jgi:hypothetical protein